MKILFLFVLLNICLFAQTWSQINLPFYGNVSEVSIPSNNKELIYTCGDDGIFKSTNSGLTWTQLIGPKPYQSIQVSSLNNNYIITDRDYSTDGGNSWFSRDNAYKKLVLSENSTTTLFHMLSYTDQYNENVYKSTDFGLTWFNILPTRPYHREYSKLLTHPGNPNLLYVFASDTLYKSTNLGSSWVKTKYRNSDSYEYVGACLDYRNPNIILITIKDSIYKSTNGGASFIKYHNNSNPFSSNVISQIFSDPMESQVFYLSNSIYLFKSLDGGISWNFQRQLPNTISSFLGSNDNNIIIGMPRVGILKSTNQCESLLSIGYKKVGSGDLISLNNNIFYLWVESIIFKSINSGIDWKVLALYLELNIGSFAISPLDTNTIFADEYKSTNGGKTWNKMNIPTNINVVYSIYTSKLDVNLIFIKDMYGKLAKSITKGDSWVMVNCPQNIAELYLSTTNNNNLFFISKETNPSLYKSTDLGETWSKINLVIGNKDKISSLAISEFSNDLFLAANSIFHSTNEGLNWNKVYNFTDNNDHRIQQIFINPSIHLLSPHYYPEFPIIGSSNNGITWGKSSRGLPSYGSDLIFINSSGKVFCFLEDTLYSAYPIIEDPSSITILNPIGGEHWTVGSEQNILWKSGNISGFLVEFSSDGGTTWITIEHYYYDETFLWTIPNFPSSNNCQIKISSRDQIVSITSSTFSIQSTTELKQQSNCIPFEFDLSQNYPNPFNPSTVINYQIPQQNYVTLKIYDMIGNEVATLIDEIKAPGYYSVNFNASHLSTGVYFYQFKAGEFVSTKNLILMK